MRRRTAPALLASAAAVLLVAGCSSGGSSTASPSPSGGSASGGAASGSAAPAPTIKVADGPAPAVTGDPGTQPTIAKGEGKPSDALVVKKLHNGDGRVIANGDFVISDLVVQKYDETKPLESTYQTGTPAQFSVAKGQVIPALEQLVGVPAGSRVEMVVPPAAGFGTKGNPQAQVKGTDTLVFVFDVRTALPSDAKATGSQGDTPAPGLPTVTDGGAQGPKITVPSGAKPPTTLSSTRLLKGDGPEVKTGQTVVVQYTGVTWKDGKVFDSSWQRGTPAAFPIGKGAVIKGWDETIVGSHVGDRLLLVIPPDKGYGAQAQGSIPANSTLVFVVDVLAAY